MFAINEYIVISHDDFYYCPNWDEYLMNAIRESGSNFFLYTGLMIGPKQPLECNYGETYKNFNESSLIKNLILLNIMILLDQQNILLF
jgi:hypothetical protein